MKMNTPNLLTILRILMVPVFVILMLSPSWRYDRYVAGILFILASFTDTLDGYLARKHNQITVFGKLMDPLADKLLVCSALICLVDLGQLPGWIVIIIVGREFIISGFRQVAAERGIVIAASYWGKVKTVSQMVMVTLLVFNFSHPVFNTLETIFVFLSLILTVVSLVDYVWKNIDVLKEVH